MQLSLADWLVIAAYFLLNLGIIALAWANSWQDKEMPTKREQ